jgi:hypothetical protein
MLELIVFLLEPFLSGILASWLLWLCDLGLLQLQLLLIDLVGLLRFLLVKCQALLINANASLVCLCALGNFLLLDLHQGIREAAPHGGKGESLSAAASRPASVIV